MNDIQHIWSILCTNSSVDKATNNVSIFNVIEQLELQLKEGVALNAEEKSINFTTQFITLWQRNGEATFFEQLLECVDPNGKVLNKVTIPIEFVDKVKRFRSVLQIQGLKITTQGQYGFVVSVKEKGAGEFAKVKEIPLAIVFKP